MSQRRDISLWPLRLFLGVTFAFAGLQKLSNPSYLDAKSPTSVQATMLSLRHNSPIGWLLSLSSHAPVLVGLLIAFAELAVGLATLVGLWVRLAAAGGLILALTFFLTVSYHTRPYYYGSDIVFLFAWTVPLLAGRWPEPTLDAAIARRARRDPDPQRRALVLGGAGAVTLAGVAGLIGGMTAAIGRSLHDSASGSIRSTLPPAPPTAATPTPSHSASQAAKAAPLPGRGIVEAAHLPAGEALSFTDDNGDPAWLIHESAGDFKAFSAVCTHAGCTVQPSGGQFICPCHGGSYSITTGQVLGGPPPAPLTALPIKVVDGSVRLV
ncbi:MAG TPA: Rieske 2Fe-2S domain-containing protein [Mycobacteriales bacterium]|nr:Rieske 2Fe-2S domain-containing protein [Mycobacteriales bacterium]